MGRDMGRTSEVPVPGPEDTEALRIEGLRKSFGPHEVLRGVDLAVAPHEVICLIGASGSGKSTLLRCVNLLERIDAGTIWLDGQAITRPGVDENLVRRHIGIVFQSFNLFPHMTAERIVTLAPMKLLGLSRAKAVRGRRSCWTRSGWAKSGQTTRTGCPAGSSSGSRSSGRWPCGRGSCCSTR